MNTIDLIKEKYQQTQSNNGSSVLTSLEQDAFNTFNELDTGKKRTDGSMDALKKAGMPDDHILTTALKTLDDRH